MMHLPASVRVYLCLNPCDMRRSFDGLHALVRDHLQLDPFAGHLLPVRQQKKRSPQDPLLGPERIRHLGELMLFILHLFRLEWRVLTPWLI
jgi:hypothetical protein